MKIYVTHSTSFDFSNELYKPIRESKFNTKHEIFLPHEKSDGLFSSKEMMPSFDLIIAEVSYPSTGQGIELGWADMAGIPIIAIYKKGMKYSSSLKAVTDKFYEYDDLNGVLKSIQEDIYSKE